MLYLTRQPKPQSLELQRALGAADSYLYLGLPEEALREFEELNTEERTEPAAMRARIRVLLHLGRWTDAESLARAGLASYPEENEFMVQQAFALHQLARDEDAFAIIRTAPEWLRRTGILHYNLACYEAQLGDLDTARECIRAAIEINAAFKKNARKDPDLKPLWN